MNSTKINILIPMAGRGKRFKQKGFEVPKPLIEFKGKTMIEYAIKSLDIKGNYIFIVYKYSDESLNIKLSEILNNICSGCRIIEIDYITEGPACSALLAKEFINNDDELIITNCDQIMNWDSSKFINFIKEDKFDGLVVTYDSDTNKNSYIRVDENGYGLELAEKKVISNLSLNGIHYWRKGKYFVESTQSMIEKNIRVNNEFYISQTYNELISKYMKIGNYHIGLDNHHAVGTPEDLEKYLTYEDNKI